MRQGRGASVPRPPNKGLGDMADPRYLRAMNRTTAPDFRCIAR